MNIQYDKIADAAYLKLSESAIVETRRSDDHLMYDIDKDGNIVGIEILNFSSNKDGLENLKMNVLNGVPVEITSSTPSLA